MSDSKAETALNEDLAAETVVEALPAEREETPTPESLGIDLPDEAEGAIDILSSEVAKARDEAGSYLDDLKRVAADFDNYRKRTMREQSEMHQRATEKVIVGLMPVLDTFDAALGTEPSTDGERQLFSGIVNTREQLLKTLEDAGLEVIPTIEEPFNPELHEPVGAPEGSGELIVSQELRRGYRLNGKILRAALVMLEVRE